MRECPFFSSLKFSLVKTKSGVLFFRISFFDDFTHNALIEKYFIDNLKDNAHIIFQQKFMSMSFI